MVRSLECRAVSFSRNRVSGPAVEVLTDIGVRFSAGRIALIQGDTGSGKTTLLGILAGLLRPCSGEVLADGEPVSRWMAPHRDRWRRRLGIVFQRPRLVDGLTVLENVMLPLVPRSGTVSAMRAAGMESLDRLGLASLAGQTAAALSGGQRQAVGVARALVGRPEILIADEPTAHQDAAAVRRLMEPIEAAAREQSALVVLAAHDPRLAAHPMVDDRLLLAGGRLAVAP